MSDAMQVAHQRRKDYQNSIARKETEIAELKELIADLDSFMEFGEALLTEGSDTPAKETPSPVVQVTKPLPELDPEDEWAQDEKESENSNMARVLSQRTG